MRVVDTNVLLHAVNPAAREHARSATFLRRTLDLPGAWLLTWNIVYEFLRVSTHTRVFPRPLTPKRAWTFLSFFLERGAQVLVQTARHVEMLDRSLMDVPSIGGSRMHDLATAVLMREHGIREIVTFDTDFHAFPWLGVTLP